MERPEHLEIGTMLHLRQQPMLVVDAVQQEDQTWLYLLCSKELETVKATAADIVQWLTPSNEELLQSAKDHPPDPSWWDEDMSGL